MGLTLTTVESYGDDIRRVEQVEAEFDASYTGGGEPFTASDVRLGSIGSVTVASGASPGGYVPRFDADSNSILMFEEDATAGPLAEVADGSDLSGETVRLTINGRS